MYNMRRRGQNEGHMFVPKVLTLYHPKTGKKSSIEGTFMNYVFNFYLIFSGKFFIVLKNSFDNSLIIDLACHF